MVAVRHFSVFLLLCIVEHMLQRPAIGEISDGFSGPSEPVTLVFYGPAQREVKLAEEQKPAAQAINEQYRNSLKDLYARELPDDQLRESVARELERANAKINDILTPQQRERLKQIGLQIREDVSKYSLTDITLVNEALRDELKLSNEQRLRMDQIGKETEQSRQQLRQEMRRLRFTGKKEQQEYIYKQIGQASFERLFNLLTPQQQEHYQQLKGAKFDYPLDDLPL